MARSDAAREDSVAHIGCSPEIEGETGLNRLGARLARYAAAASVAWFMLCVTASAQLLGKPAGPKFKAPPPPTTDPDAQAKAAEDSASYILGFHINTIFFVVAGILGVLWFVFGGGRKPKITRH